MEERIELMREIAEEILERISTGKTDKEIVDSIHGLAKSLLEDADDMENE